LAECRKLIHDYEIKHEMSVINDNNIGKFYSFVNGKMACPDGVGALKQVTAQLLFLTAPRQNY